jgi:hypothetical protein
MGEDKHEDIQSRSHKMARGLELGAVFSILLLVPFVRRRREQLKRHRRGRFAIVCH